MSSALRFGAIEIERWAAFSGDRNPIHFDRQAAAALGVDEVVVHGMIPAVLALDAADRARRAAGPVAGRSACKLWLRRPVLRDQPVHLDLRSAGGGMRFALRDVAGGTHLQGTLGPAEPEPAGRPAVGVVLPPLWLDGEAVAAQAAAFAEVFPQVRSGWVGLAAILFAAFLERGLGPLREESRRALGLLPDAAAVAVQTSLSVCFNEERFTGPVSDLGPCGCAYEPVPMYHLQGGCAAECRWTVQAGGPREMEMSVGLLLKVQSIHGSEQSEKGAI